MVASVLLPNSVFQPNECFLFKRLTNAHGDQLLEWLVIVMIVDLAEGLKISGFVFPFIFNPARWQSESPKNHIRHESGHSSVPFAERVNKRDLMLCRSRNL